jgi:hypothetical protein
MSITILKIAKNEIKCKRLLSTITALFSRKIVTSTSRVWFWDESHRVLKSRQNGERYRGVLLARVCHGGLVIPCVRNEQRYPIDPPSP